MKKKIRQSNRMMQIITIVLLALTLFPSIVFAATQSAEVLSAPDLALDASDISFSPTSAIKGSPVAMTAVIHNIGGSTATAIMVQYYIDGTPVVQKEIDEIPPDSQRSVSINFIFLYAGSHNVTVIADPNDAIIEQNEENNQATKFIDVSEPAPTEPSTISLSAYPEVIEADGVDTSTITAIVTDEYGEGASGIEVTFSTSRGTIESPKTTTNGIATTILTSSTSPGTAVVGANAIVNGIPVSDTVHVTCIKTAEAECNETMGNITVTVEKAITGTTVTVTNTTVTLKDGVITINTTVENATKIAGNATADSVISISIKGGKLEITLEENATAVNNTVTGNISKIKLNTPAESYKTSKPDVGVVTADLDVEFKGDFTPANLGLTLTLLEHYDVLGDFIPASGSEITKNIIATFGIEGVTTSDIQENTAILVHSELAGTYIENNVTGVPISITVNREWFDSIAGGDINNVTMFKVNGTTGEVESKITMTSGSITINDGTVTFATTFDHFCVFAIVAKPTVAAAAPIYYRPGGRRVTPAPSPIPAAPSPGDTTPLIITNVYVTLGHSAIISWDTNKPSDSLVKCGMKSRQYNIEKYDPNSTLSHSIHLDEINKSGTYFFVVKSTDPSGNAAQIPEYIFLLTPPSKEGRSIRETLLPFIPYFVIPLWIALVAIIAALIISLIIYKRWYQSGRIKEIIKGSEIDKKREEAISELNRKFARGEISVGAYIKARKSIK